MTTPKLPPEAELDMIEKCTDIEGEHDEQARMHVADFRALLALGREYYALRRKLRELAAGTAWQKGDRVAISASAQAQFARDLEALLGEDAQ